MHGLQLAAIQKTIEAQKVLKMQKVKVNNMAKNSQTTQTNSFLTKTINGTVLPNIADNSRIPEPIFSYDWHIMGESMQQKIGRAVSTLAREGNPSPTEAQIKSRFSTMGGKTI